MTVQVLILQGAQADLRELRGYVQRRFGVTVWQASLTAIRQAIARIAQHPNAGTAPDELAALNPAQYRQALAGKNRIIYELRGDAVYIHLVCDTRRDLRAVLLRRLLEAPGPARE